LIVLVLLVFELINRLILTEMFSTTIDRLQLFNVDHDLLDDFVEEKVLNLLVEVLDAVVLFELFEVLEDVLVLENAVELLDHLTVRH
jgi:hypothetical protein